MSTGPKLRRALLNSWYQETRWFTYLLLPFSLVFYSVQKIRYFLYQTGILKQTTFKVPVIVVGNLSVGGTGKTPLMASLANYLQSVGFKPGIVLRGYNGRAKNWPQIVSAQSDPCLVGDEAVFLAQQTRLPVVAAPRRVAAVQTLINHFSCDVVLSDDGLQHYALGRQVEIAVLDGKYRLGNGYCLPAGPLREPPSRLKQVDFVVVNGRSATQNEYAMQLIPDKLYKLLDPTQTWNMPLLEAVKVHAIAGIGFPQRFFETLTQLSFEVIPHPFPDHHLFSANDINLPDYPIIMTAKDAVKCQAFADERHWCLSVKAELTESFLSTICKKLGPASVVGAGRSLG